MRSTILIVVDSTTGHDLVIEAAHAAILAVIGTKIKVIEAEYTLGNPKAPDHYPLEVPAAATEPVEGLATEASADDQVGDSASCTDAAPVSVPAPTGPDAPPAAKPKPARKAAKKAPAKKAAKSKRK